MNKAPIDGSNKDTFTDDTKPPRDVSVDFPKAYKKNPNVSFSVLAEDYLITSDPDSFQELVDSGKNNFHDLLIGIQGLMNDVVSTQNLQDLDDTTRIKLSVSQTQWRDIMAYVRSYATSINRRITGLSNAIIVDKNGQLHYDENAVCGGSIHFTFDEKNAPHLLSLHLSDLLTDFCYFSVQLVKAVHFQHGVFSLFDKNPQKTEEIFNSRLNAIMQSLSVLGKQVDNIQKRQEESQRQSVVQSDRSIRKLEKIEDKVDKKNRADKRKPLTQEECAELLYQKKVKYCKKKENYLMRVGITATVQPPPKNAESVKRTIQRWDQYLLSNGEKGTKPAKGYSREANKLEFESWAETLELIKYERWEKRQTPIGNIYRQTATDTPEDEEYLEEDEEDQESRAEEDMVDRLTRTSKRY